jgi:hypothetical protein
MPDLVPPTQFDREANNAGAVLDDSDERFQLGDSCPRLTASSEPHADARADWSKMSAPSCGGKTLLVAPRQVLSAAAGDL